MAAPLNVDQTLQNARLNSVGVNAITQCLRQLLRNATNPQLHAMAIAYLTVGLQDDRTHNWPQNGFHMLWDIARTVRAVIPDAISRERKEFKDALLRMLIDLITALDRVTGGTSILFHHPGSQQPGALLVPHHLRTHLYINPVAMNEIPGAAITVSRMNQLFAEELAIPMAQRWRLAFHNARGPLPPPQQLPNIPDNPPLFPTPTRSFSPHYICIAQPIGQLEARLNANDAGHFNATAGAIQQTQTESHDDAELIAHLVHEIEGLHITNDEEIARLNATIAALRAHIATLQRGLEPHALFPQRTIHSDAHSDVGTTTIVDVGSATSHRTRHRAGISRVREAHHARAVRDASPDSESEGPPYLNDWRAWDGPPPPEGELDESEWAQEVSSANVILATLREDSPPFRAGQEFGPEVAAMLASHPRRERYHELAYQVAHDEPYPTWFDRLDMAMAFEERANRDFVLSLLDAMRKDMYSNTSAVTVRTEPHGL